MNQLEIKERPLKLNRDQFRALQGSDAYVRMLQNRVHVKVPESAFSDLTSTYERTQLYNELSREIYRIVEMSVSGMYFIEVGEIYSGIEIYLADQGDSRVVTSHLREIQLPE